MQPLTPTTRFADPQVSGQLGFRIGLARKRTGAYPLDTLDFILMDLERPDRCSRQAHWCTGDLSGRVLEFLSCAEGVDGQTDPRLPELFERILRQRRPSGLFGSVYGQSDVAEDHPEAGGDRLFPGLIRYYELTGDWQALEAAVGIAERLMASKDGWQAWVRERRPYFPIEAWISEPFARLYGLTGEQRYLDHCAFVAEQVDPSLSHLHSHGFLCTMRGLQLAALYTGDLRWNEQPEYYRRLILDQRMTKPDGCLSECLLPNNFRNEGCAEADWMQLNLYAALLNGDAASYEEAEKILWNAVFHNQFITGGFGHRDLTPQGYGLAISEAWWCCTEHCGMAMAELARQVVTSTGPEVRVNFLIPGRYRLALPGHPDAEIEIATDYPASAEAIIEARGLPEEYTLTVRVPGCVVRPELEETRVDGRRRVRLSGKLGHRVLSLPEGEVLTWGPLVLAPLTYYWDMGAETASSGAPAGYIPPTLPAGMPQLLPGAADADGFVVLAHEPLPDWSYFDEGPGARVAVGQTSVHVPVRFPGGEERVLWFTPLCYNTSDMTYYETPILFARSKGSA